jgi:peptidoglycan hydrolase CwlO-like protein
MRQRIAMLEGELEFAKIFQELQQPPTSVMINSTASNDDHMPIVRQLQMQCDQLNNDKRRLESDVDRIREQLQTTQHNCDQLRKEVDARGAQIRIMRAEQQKSIEVRTSSRC